MDAGAAVEEIGMVGTRELGDDDCTIMIEPLSAELHNDLCFSASIFFFFKP